MLKHSLINFIKKLFITNNYGDNLRCYIIQNNPQTTADVEILEKEWLYMHTQTLGGKWL